jgi:Recombination endonuclease VII
MTKERAEYHRKWRARQIATNPIEYRKKNAEASKRRYHSNPDIAKDQQRNFKNSYDNSKEFREKIILAASLSRYGTTVKKYEKLLAEQGNHCALCPSTTGDSGRRLHMDHSHDCCDFGPPRRRTCGKCNRGLLCGPCNRRLASVEDILKEGSIAPSPGTWLDRAIQYLKKYQDSKA